MATNTTVFQGFTNVPLAQDWRATLRDLDKAWPGVLASSNADIDGTGGPTDYGRVWGGTILGKDSLGAYHPAGLMELSGAMAGVNLVPLNGGGAKDEANFFVGDIVAIIREHRLGKTLPITGTNADETFTSAAHGLRVGQLVELREITGGAGAAPGTYVVATVPTANTFTLTGVAFTTDITAGFITVYAQDLTGNRNISAVDRSAHTVTVDGAAITAAAGDLLVKVNCYRPEGPLCNVAFTKRYEVDGTALTYNKEVSIAYAADLRAKKCPGLGTRMIELLNGGPYRDPMLGTIVVPKFEGFIVQDI